MPPSETPLPGRPVRGSATGRPIMALLDLLGRRWALRVLWGLRSGPGPGFRELQSRGGGVSSRVPTDRIDQLREARLGDTGHGRHPLAAPGTELDDAS